MMQALDHSFLPFVDSGAIFVQSIHVFKGIPYRSHDSQCRTLPGSNAAYGLGRRAHSTW
jgi:hypothetical protein